MRRPLLLATAALGGLVLLGGLAAWLFYGRIGAWVIEDKVIPRLEARLGVELNVGDIEVERGTVVLHDLSIPSESPRQPELVRIDELEATFDYGASWLGEVKVHDVSMRGVRLNARREIDGRNELRELMSRVVSLGGAEDEEGEKKRGTGLMPRSVEAEGISAELYDELTHMRLKMSETRAAAELDADEDGSIEVGYVELVAPRGPLAELRNIRVSLDPGRPLESAQAEVGGGVLRLWPGMRLTGIHGTLQHSDRAGRLVVDLKGGYGGAEGTLWEADGWLEPSERKGEIDLVADRFTLDKIATVLEDSMLFDVENTSIDAALRVELSEGRATLAGKVAVEGLNVEHEKLAQVPMHDISFSGELSARVDSRARQVHLDSADVVSKGVHYLLRGSASAAGGLEADGLVREHPRFDLHLEVPKAGCQAVLESIPPEMVPKLQGFQLKGTFDATLDLAIDWSNIEENTVLSADVGLPNCKVIEPADEFDAKRLLESFEHQIMVGPEEFETVAIGMESDSYVQIFDISPYFLNAIMTTEDSRFYDHDGFIGREFRSALVRNLEAGHFKFGASSITMQMVKNVFLYRDKTISRKLQELFLTWYVESILDKNRILEIYVNAIEYGPAIYGIKQAAETYLDKHPRDISPREAAWLASLLPSPRRRYFQYCQDKLTRKGTNKVSRVLGNMFKRERLTAEEHDEAQAETIEFNPEKVRELCRKRPDW